MKKDIYTIDGIEGTFYNKSEVRDQLQFSWECGDTKYEFEVKKNGRSITSFDELN